MHGTRKGQVSMEQLIVVAIGLALIAALAYFALNTANDNLRVSQANDMVQKLSASSDYVYSLGPGSNEVVTVYVPDGVVFTNITNKTVHVRIALSSGESDIFAEGKPVLIGEIPTTPGQQDVLVTHTESGKVMFGRTSLSCSPLSLTKSIVQGQNATDTIIVRNIGEYRVQNLSATIEGDVSDMMQFSQPANSIEPGANTQVGLSFAVPESKETGSYPAIITISGDLQKNDTFSKTECSSMINILVEGIRPPDTNGPLVTSLGHKPRNPTIFTRITVQATADDSTTGGSPIKTCEIELDGLGTWAEMTAVDGAYNDVMERVTYSIGPLPQGQHSISVRCMDDELNLGPERSDNFTVYSYTKEIVFVTNDPTPSASEQRWLDWLDSHTSDEGFAWNYDTFPSALVAEGLVNLSNYQILLIADADCSCVASPQFRTFKNTGHYIVVLGDAMQHALTNLDIGASGNGNSRSDYRLLVNNIHYITDGYTIGTQYTVTNGTWPIYYHNSFDAIKVLSVTTQERFSAGDAAYVVTYGVTRPDKMIGDGNVFATRVLDHALLNS